MRLDFSLLRYQNGINKMTEYDPSMIPSVQVHCMNIMDGDISNPINKLEGYAGNSNARINIIMIHNVESIPVNELRRLNFLFRVTDKSYIYANIVILLLWNTQERAFTDEERRLYGVVDDGETESNDVGTSISLRSFLSAEWSKSGPDVSGRALSGRITRTAFSAKEDLTSGVSMALSCSTIRDERKRALEKENDCTTINKMKLSAMRRVLLKIFDKFPRMIQFMRASMEQVHWGMMDVIKKCRQNNYFKLYFYVFSLLFIFFLWRDEKNLNRRLDDVNEQLRAIVKRSPADGDNDTSSGEQAVEKLNCRLDDLDYLSKELNVIKAIVKRTPADGAYDTSLGEQAVEKLNRRLDDVNEQLKAILKRTPADGAYDTSSGEQENVETSVDDPPNPPEMNG